MNKNYLNTINWNRVKGNFESLKKYRQAGASDRYFERVTPKAVVFQFQTVIGDTNAYAAEIVQNDSAIDQAILQYYTYIRSFNSSLGAYTPADVMKYVIAISNLYGVWMHVYKSLGTFFHSNVLNRGATEQLRVIFTQNNAEQVNENLADYMARLNVLKDRITAFTLPTNIPFVNRLMYLCGSIFADEPSNDYASFAAFMPVPLEWQVDITDSLPGSLLNTITSGIMDDVTINAYLKWMERAVTKYATDQDVTNISSEMFKAQGQVQGKYDLPDVTLETLRGCFKPIFDLNVLDEIRNANMAFPDVSQVGTYQAGIQEDAHGRLKNSIIIANNTGYGLIPATPTTQSNPTDLKGYEDLSLLYSHELNPDGDTVTNISHLKFHLYSYSAAASAPSYIYGIKTEWIWQAFVCYTDKTTGQPVVGTLCSFNPYENFYEPLLSGLIDLDWCPDLWYGPITNDKVTGVIRNIHGVTDNYALVSTDQLMSMSRIAIGYLFSALDGATDAFNGKSTSKHHSKGKDKGKSKDK